MSGKHTPSGEPSQPLRATDAPDALRDEVAHLHEAMKSQRDIGMAIGLLSAKFGCSTEQAWRTMLRVSQDSNTKVRTVAHVLVTVHDGTSGPEDQQVLERFEDQLPASGWPEGPST
ncbi:ANTAR domain-containing protein [Nocardioides zhouii]|uniref:ANTAR domain-containing protein n=1 Tax=Nocardioides zhouii TaxID=1168729 RepID=A0A4V1RQW7_9ACTN|nr:ANTAR domain-containing protein [Nocardioides zhouii]RYC14297.1 ANTAR domain-containing protein [Nocardioides zhouii]